jgi:cytochrome P450
MVQPLSPTASPIERDEARSIDLGPPQPGADPYGGYSSLAACAIHRVRLGQAGEPVPGPLGEPLWFANGYDAVTEALLSDAFTIDPRVGLPPAALAELPGMDPELAPIFRNLLSLDPPDHTRLRRLVQPSFTARAVQSLRPRIRRIADDLLDAAEAAAAGRGERRPDRSLELIDALAYPLPIAVIFELLGIPHEDRDRVRAWAYDLLTVGPAADAENTKRVLGPFVGYARDLVAAKRTRPADDLLSSLIAAEEDGDRLDEDELLSMVFILVLAGFVTTVNLIGNGVFALLTHPTELAKLRADPGLIPGAVEEILRFWGPVEIASERYARTAIEFHGATIEQADLLISSLAAANRDPARFSDPDAFDVTRSDANRHVAFGKGIHACLGAPLARLEGEVALAALLERCPDLHLAVPAEDVQWHPGPLRGLVALPLAF